MEVELIKNIGGSFSPASDIDEDKIRKIKNGTQLTVNIKIPRNKAFHGKVFKFFDFTFQYWCANNQTEFMDLSAQFDTFRKNLTVLAGYRVDTWAIDGSLRVDAKSLSFGSMDQDEFEECFSALINAAIKHVFANTTDEKILSRLQEFF